MARMVVIYKMPRDPAAFDRHYFQVHVPLAKQLPGLREYSVSRGPIATPAGGPPFHMVAALRFDSLAAIREAFATPEGQACGADRRILAPDDQDVIMLLFDDREV
ncbi:MAG: EthD family reductase [Stellaceae bacterium]